jgi:LPXTG-site transpeptidase (sortase) family protein
LDLKAHPIVRQRRRWLAALTLVALGLAIGCFGAATAFALHTQSDSQLQRALPSPDARAIVPVAKPRPGKQLPRPVRIAIPAIGVSAPVIPLYLNRDQTLQVPKAVSKTGWFVDGPEPGENGAAVIVGHVDSKNGPGVFYRLRALKRGDKINVVLKNKSTVRFVVLSGKKVPKNKFPTKLVYGKTPGPTLRLITCDGRFDRSTGHYVDNYVVFATAA